MKLSIREQVLLAVLAVIALLAVGYYLVYTPMWETYGQLQIQLDETQMNYDAAMAKIASVDKIKGDVATLSAQVVERTKPYFPSIIQEKLMLTLDDLYSESDVSVNDETFTLMVTHDLPRASGQAAEEDPNNLAVIVREYKGTMGEAMVSAPAEKETSEEEMDAMQGAVTSIDSMNLNVSFVSTYAQAIDLMANLEGLDRSVQIQSVDMKPGDATEQTILDTEGNPVTVRVENGLLDCNFTVAFNAIPKLVTQDEEYELWDLTGPYGKEDPFVAQTN